jgi:hypothetical protein
VTEGGAIAPLVAGQHRLANIGGREFRVRLIQTAPENQPAWIVAITSERDGDVPPDLMFLICNDDLGDVLPIG